MKVRLITWIGLILGALALLMVGRVPLVVSLVIGLVGLAISVVALLTSKD
jgi:hypothetical protein